MKKTITYIITSITCIFVGCAGMYVLIYFFPSAIIDTITREEKMVTLVDDGISQGIENVQNSVVTIEGYLKNTLYSTGSGFIYKIENNKAYILTNHHVIEKVNKIIVTLLDGTEFTATLVGSDEYADVAVLTITSDNNMVAATIGNGEDTKVGDTIFTIGSPMGKEYAGTVTRGILSGKDRMISTASSDTYTASTDWITRVMQTDAAINPGNSGGPLCNVSGKVIGINSMKVVESSVEGIGFAIPIEDAMGYAKSIETNGKIIRSYIGISMIDATETFYLAKYNIRVDSSVTAGTVIAEIVESSPASKSELEIGDVIYKIENKEIENTAEFRYYLYQYAPGDKITLTIYREGKSKEIDVTLGKSN